MNCQKCGAKKTQAVKEVIGPSEAEVSDQEMLNKAEAGANWICKYCDGQERNLNGECKTCGGPRLRDLTGPENNLPRAVMMEDGKYNLHASWRPSKWASENPFIITIVGLTLAALAGFLVWLSTPRYVNVKVNSIHWQFTKTIRSRATLHGSEWGRPEGKGYFNEPSFDVNCESKYYETVSCHPYDCNPHKVSYSCNCHNYPCNCDTKCINQNNGFSKCSKNCDTCNKCSTCYQTKYETCYESCPVYKDWCEYSYYDWSVTNTQVTSGDSHYVYWPDLEADGLTQKLQKSEMYRVIFTCPGDRFEYTPKDIYDFNRFNIGDTWKLRVGKVRDHSIEEMIPIKSD